MRNEFPRNDDGLPADPDAEQYVYDEYHPSEARQAAEAAFENPSVLRPIEEEELPWESRQYMPP